MSDFEALLFALDDEGGLGRHMAEHLGIGLSPHEIRQFDGGEHKMRPLVNVRNRDVHVLASLAGDRRLSANDRLCRTLFFIGSLRQASARSVTAVVPYICYSRKDRQTKGRDPVTTRYVAQLFEAVGTDRLVTVDVHNLAAFQNAARCRTDHVEATQLFVDHFSSDSRMARLGEGELVVVSPDTGGVKRADRLRRRLADHLGRQIGLAFAGKLRSRGVVSGPDRVLGEVDGATTIVVDDMIVSGTTMARVAAALVAQGAGSVHLLATHALFTPDAATLFDDPSIDSVVVTDTVPPGRLGAAEVGGRLVTLSMAPLLAEALSRIQSGGSLTELLHLDM